MSRGVEESRSRGVEEKVGETASQHGKEGLIVEIWPEPAPEERRAILLALGQMVGETGTVEPTVSRWGRAGRLDAVTRGRGLGTGWGQGRNRPVASAIAPD